MGRAEPGSVKAISNAIKSKGLQRLRWYCQACEKQCRDENGFKCHQATEAHLRKMITIGEKGAGRLISDYSSQFKSGFLQILSRRWNTQRVEINRVYQEYIADKDHIHMNATRWVSLTQFAAYLGREGICHVEQTEKGWFVSWIDNSPKALARQAESQKRERGEVDEETRQRRLLQEQIKRAQEEEASKQKQDEPVSHELDTAKKVATISFGAPKAAAPIKLATATNPIKKPNPLKARPNPLKEAKANPPKADPKPKRPSSALEEIIQQDMARKERLQQQQQSKRIRL